MTRLASLLLVSFLGGYAFGDDRGEFERRMLLEAMSQQRKEQKARLLEPFSREIKVYDEITKELLKSIPNGTFANFVNITGPQILKIVARRTNVTREYFSHWVFGRYLFNWGSRPPK